MLSLIPWLTNSRQITDGSFPIRLATNSKRVFKSVDAVNVIRSVFFPSSTNFGLLEKSSFSCIDEPQIELIIAVKKVKRGLGVCGPPYGEDAPLFLRLDVTAPLASSLIFR